MTRFQRLMRTMAKVANPLIRRLAGRRLMSTAALLRHRGRRSGKTYITPVGARVKGEVCLIPLASGTEADWCRNIRSAGRGQLRWKAREYELAAPVVLTTELAGPFLSQIYPVPLRLGFKMLGTKAFLRMEAAPLLIIHSGTPGEGNE